MTNAERRLVKEAFELLEKVEPSENDRETFAKAMTNLALALWRIK